MNDKNINIDDELKEREALLLEKEAKLADREKELKKAEEETEVKKRLRDNLYSKINVSVKFMDVLIAILAVLLVGALIFGVIQGMG